MQACHLQSLERTTSEAIGSALRKQSSSSSWSDQFQFRALVTARDKASSNLKAEKLLLADMAVPWAHLPLHCEVHDTAHIFGAVYDGLCASHVTGLINVGLSLRVAGSLAAFRCCLREVILESLEFKRGQPSDEAKRFKRIVLDAFATPKSKNVQQMLLLSLLPNGDWRSPTVEHYLDYDATDEDKPKVAAKLEAGLVQALLRKKPQTWARHRWGGCDVALEELGLLEGVHQLLSRTYKRFVHHLQAGKSCKQQGFGNVMSHDTLEQGLGIHTSAHEGMHSTIEADAEVTSDHCFASSNNVPSTSADMETGSQFAAENASQRRKALEWLSGSSCLLETLLMMRLTMVPLVALLHRQFQVCSQEWERHQQAQAVMNLQNGQVQGCLVRDYMVSLAAESSLEMEFHELLADCFRDKDKWHAIDFHRTSAMNTLAFRCLSREGCMVESRIGHPHKQCPYKTFRMLKHPEFRAVLKESSPCMLDDFTSELVKVCPDFEGARCLQILHMNACLCWTSIATLESLHSTVRRQAVLRSTQTHALQVPFLSAEFYLQKLRIAGGLRQHESKKMSSNQSSVKKQVLKSKKRRFKPGPWRAFVRQRTLQQIGIPDLGSIATEYRKAKAESTEDYMHASATSAAAVVPRVLRTRTTNKSNLGARGRDVQRQATKMKRKALWVATSTQAPVPRGEALANLTSTTQTLPEALSAARRLQMLDGAASRQARQADLEILRNYDTSVGAETLAFCKRALPHLPLESWAPRALPAADGPLLYLPGSSAAVATDALAWAHLAQSSNLPSALEKEWQSAHETIPHETHCVQAVVRENNACRLAGVCLCSRLGKSLLALRNVVVKEMKTEFGSKLSRAPLASGDIVLRLCCQVSCSACIDGDERRDEVFLHVGHISFSPYKPVYHELKRYCSSMRPEVVETFIDLQTFSSATPVQCKLAALDLLQNDCATRFQSNMFLAVASQATLRFLTEFEALDTLCRSCTWQLEWYELDKSLRPVDIIHPEYIRVLQLHEGSVPKHIWPKQTRPRKKRLHHPFLAVAAKKSLRGSSTTVQTGDSVQDDASSDDDVSESSSVAGDSPDHALSTVNSDLVALAEDWNPLFDSVDLQMLDEKDPPHVSSIPTDEEALEKAEAATLIAACAYRRAHNISPPRHPTSASEAQQSASSHELLATGLPHIYGPRAGMLPAAAGCKLEGGRIHFHHSKQSFEAWCSQHKGCSLSRTQKARKKAKTGGLPQGGRPLGFLAAWLSLKCESKM
eukprot:2838343-Amphidinium_carterae.1